MTACGITRRRSQWVNGALQSNIRCVIAGLGRREGAAIRSCHVTPPSCLLPLFVLLYYHALHRSFQPEILRRIAPCAPVLPRSGDYPRRPFLCSPNLSGTYGIDPAQEVRASRKRCFRLPLRNSPTPLAAVAPPSANSTLEPEGTPECASFHDLHAPPLYR